MDEYNQNSHAVYDIKYHLIWVTKYRCPVLKGSVASRVRELVRQGCTARGITILQGSVGKEHIHLLISCPPTIAPSKLMQYLKGRTFLMYCDDIQDMDLTAALESLMGLFVDYINTETSTTGEVIKSQLIQWINSQAIFIKALFKDLNWES
ncbi:MAG: IS200/IS605 family transposase [Cellulosilyticaceae bacterium]